MAKEYVERTEAVYLARRVVMDYHQHRRKATNEKVDAIFAGVMAGLVLLFALVGVYTATMAGNGMGVSVAVGLVFSLIGVVIFGMLWQVASAYSAGNYKSDADYEKECFGDC